MIRFLLGLSIFLGIFFPASATTERYFRNGLFMTMPVEGAVASKGAQKDALRSLRTFLKKAKVEKVILERAGSPEAVIWEDRVFGDHLSAENVSLNTCLSILFNAGFERGHESRVGCRFYDPEIFLSAIFHKEGTLIVSTSPLKTPVVDDKLSVQKLKETYDLYDLRNGDKPWVKKDLTLLNIVLAELNPREKALLGDLPFERTSNSKTMGHPGAAGMYMPRAERFRSRIVIFDSFNRSIGSFSGTPEKHYSPGSHTLFHELGHALAFAGIRAQANAAENDGYRGRWERLHKRNEIIRKKYNALSAKAQTQHPQAGIAVKKSLEKLNAFTTATNAMNQAMQKYYAPVEKDGTRVVRALLRLLPQKDAVTKYGKTGPEEAFAEAYMLFKADPEALGRISPAALSFFENGLYLKIIEAEVKIADPNRSRKNLTKAPNTNP